MLFTCANICNTFLKFINCQCIVRNLIIYCHQDDNSELSDAGSDQTSDLQDEDDDRFVDANDSDTESAFMEDIDSSEV